jgi:anti-anti-sigma factor
MPISDWSDSILIAELGDEPSFSEDTETLVRRLEESADAPPDVIINMQAVSYMNSSNIAQLLRVRKKLKDSGGRLRLCAVNNHVWSLMLATGLDAVFEFTEDISTSIASLQIDEAG